jgi:hypothetical protein
MSENDTSENDNLGNEVTFSQVIKKADDAYMKLHKQSVKTPAAVKIRDEVSLELCDIVELLKALRNTFSDTAPTSLKANVLPKLLATGARHNFVVAWGLLHCWQCGTSFNRTLLATEESETL